MSLAVLVAPLHFPLCRSSRQSVGLRHALQGAAREHLVQMLADANSVAVARSPHVPEHTNLVLAPTAQITSLASDPLTGDLIGTPGWKSKIPIDDCKSPLDFHVEIDFEGGELGEFPDGVPGVASAQECCKMCRLMAGCKYWTFADGGHFEGQCWLKENKNAEQAQKRRVSGEITAKQVKQADYRRRRSVFTLPPALTESKSKRRRRRTSRRRRGKSSAPTQPLPPPPLGFGETYAPTNIDDCKPNSLQPVCHGRVSELPPCINHFCGHLIIAQPQSPPALIIRPRVRAFLYTGVRAFVCACMCACVRANMCAHACRTLITLGSSLVSFPTACAMPSTRGIAARCASYRRAASSSLMRRQGTSSIDVGSRRARLVFFRRNGAHRAG